MTFATCQINGKPRGVFGLPGNPVSATVTSILYVIPAMRRIEKKVPATFPRIKVILVKMPNNVDIILISLSIFYFSV